MRRVMIGVVILLVLIGVASVARIAPTPPRPTLADVNLETLVLQPDDFPPGTLDGAISDSPAPLFRDPAVVQSYMKLIQQDGNYVVGEIFVTVYRDAAAAKARYDENDRILVQAIADQFPVQSPAIGEHASLQQIERSTSLSFVRCHAFVMLNLDISKDMMLAYGKRLDQRLQAATCL